MLLLSRSAYEERRKCARAFYYRYLFAGPGYTESRTPFHLAFGIAVHEGMATLISTAELVEEAHGLAGEVDVDLSISTARAAWAYERPSGSFPPKEPPQEEVLALLEALILGWVRVEAPRFFEEYEIVSVEREGAPQPLSPSTALQFRCDVVVRSRYTGLLRVINWKTSSSWGDWTSKWQAEVQGFSEAWALAQESGEAVEGTVMAGLSKGSLRTVAGAMHFGSPLIWGYKRQMPDGSWVYNADTKAPKGEGWVKFPVWEETFPGEVGKGVAAWVAWLPLHVVAASFMTSEVLVGTQEAVDDFIACAAHEAQQDHHVLTEGSEKDRLLHFKASRSFWNCGSDEEPKCTFYEVCNKGRKIESLIEEGRLVPRKDHHAVS